MIMLQDQNGVSRHTAAEVYLDKKWQYIDPWLGVFPHKADGTAYTRFEFAKDQSALVKYGYAPNLTGYEFANSVVFETFPFMSFSRLVQKIVSKLDNLRESTATNPGGLSNVEQTEKTEDFSSSPELTRSQVEVLKHYDKARANHLDEDFAKARADYQELMKNEQITSIAEAARFFFGVTYFDQHMWADAEKYFINAIVEHGNNPWINSEYRFLAESLIAQGKISEAKNWLSKSASQGAIARLNNLNTSLKHGRSISFISH